MLGGGHAPDIIVVCGLPRVLPSSTNPTRPFAKNTLDEHLDASIPWNASYTLPCYKNWYLSSAESRIHAKAVAAKDVLPVIGAISMISCDSQAMGRVGEVVSWTCWRTAASYARLDLAWGSGADHEPNHGNGSCRTSYINFLQRIVS
jgi:urease